MEEKHRQQQNRWHFAAQRNHRRQKLKAKRQVIILIWSVAFAYLSLTATDADSSSSATGSGANNADDVSDVFPKSQSRYSARNQGIRAPSRAILRATGSEINETDDQNSAEPIQVTNSFIASSTIRGVSTGFETDSGLSAEATTEDSFITRTSTDEPELIPGISCTAPAIDDFPSDLFTQAERWQGYVAIHFLASVYIFYCLAVVCDEYFVPSIECICEELHVPSDVAGATFMAVGTSAPELFTNIIGTFITHGDIGVGTIVGSAVFNILGVSACCGIAAKTALPLEWYPLTRDCLFYSISVILLIVFLNNRHVFWYEALVLVVAYLVYIMVMYKNSALRNWAENLVSKIRSRLGLGYTEDDVNSVKAAKKRRASFVAGLTASTEERAPLLGSGRDLENTPPERGWLGESLDKSGDIPAEVLDEMLISSALHKSQAQAEEEGAEWSLIRIPLSEGFLVCIQWLLSWPSRFVFGFTIPDCRDEKLRRLFPITFIMCILWIAFLSYLVSWTMTVIGHTFSIPDSVMGLTFIAAGTSIPEMVSSVIVARQGLGTMSISNSIGSNTFDILVCLGVPWLIKGSMIASHSTQNFIQINSGGLEYSTMTLLFTLAMLYLILACNKFYLDKKVGFLALLLYACFLVFASLFELNVFMTVNLPQCDSMSE